MNKAVVLSIFSFLFIASTVGAEEKPVTYPSPQEAAPNIYKQLFDNERVRVSEIKFNPGDKGPMHTHAYDHLVYVIEPGQLSITQPGGTAVVVDGAAGQVLWMAAQSHEAVNTGTTTFRAIVTELK